MEPYAFAEHISSIRERVERIREMEEYTDVPVGMFIPERLNSNRKKRMKERHYNQDERQMRHNPATDWRECKRGEKCYNAASLDVSDIVTKHGVVV